MTNHWYSEKEIKDLLSPGDDWLEVFGPQAKPSSIGRVNAAWHHTLRLFHEPTECRMVEGDQGGRVPEEFTHGPHPVATTVGELIAELQRLPPHLAATGQMGGPVKLIVYTPDDPGASVAVVESDTRAHDL